MMISLIDELDTTFQKIDRLIEHYEQSLTYERSLRRMRYLAATFAPLVDDVRRIRLSVPGETWSQIRSALISERPAEFNALGRALTTGEDEFLRLVNYVGFVSGALTVIGETAVACEPTPNAD